MMDEETGASLLQAAEVALDALVKVDALLHRHGMMIGIDCPAIEPLRTAIAKARGS